MRGRVRQGRTWGQCCARKGISANMVAICCYKEAQSGDTPNGYQIALSAVLAGTNIVCHKENCNVANWWLHVKAMRFFKIGRGI